MGRGKVLNQNEEQSIAERKRTEEALRESEKKYRILVDNANDAIFVLQDDVLKFPNPKTREITGYTADQLSAMPFAELVAPEDRDMAVERNNRKMKGEDVPTTYSFRIINKAGERLWAEVNAVLITWEARPALLCFLRDITPQKKLEARFYQAQKMKALGTLAGGIVHDVNNVLTGIMGSATLMLMHIDSDHPHFRHLKGIEEMVKSVADLTEQLLSFARGDKYELKPTELNEIIKKSSGMFGRAKKEIRIHRKYRKDIWTVKVDRTQIERVLLNLYINAWQAMPRGGDLYIQMENVTLGENYSKPFGLKPGNYARVSVTDTGIGMDEETQQRIFEPFFTTKEAGKGTGLGLASAYGIIKNHGGIINVYSKKGEGTTFNIYLPAAEALISEQRPEAEEKEIQQGHETVLLVDDEDIIIEAGRDMLGAMGYKVLLARSGKEAIEVYRKNKDKIDLVVLDMIMPDMGGGEAYDTLKEIKPDIKVLLSSGYSISSKRVNEVLERGCRDFIQKPFSIKQLSQNLRRMLDK